MKGRAVLYESIYKGHGLGLNWVDTSDDQKAIDRTAKEQFCGRVLGIASLGQGLSVIAVEQVPVTQSVLKATGHRLKLVDLYA